MKKSTYLKLEDIPEADRADYALVGDKYVLQLDGVHPVQIKNTELLSEKTTKDAAHTQTVAQKDADISRLNTELATANQTQGMPAGQIAVSVADATLLNEYKGLGEVKDVKIKVEEHTALKAQAETVARQKTLSEAAKAHGLNSDAFVALADSKNLNESMESRTSKDEKGNSKTEYFVKTKDGTGTEILTSLTDYVKENDAFKPFLPSLFAKQEAGKETVRIPGQKTGDAVTEQDASDIYIGSTYKRPDKTA